MTGSLSNLRNDDQTYFCADASAHLQFLYCRAPFVLTPLDALGFLFATSYPIMPEPAGGGTEQSQVRRNDEELLKKQLASMLIYWY